MYKDTEYPLRLERYNKKRWYQKFQIQLTLNWHVFPNSETVTGWNWVFNFEPVYITKNKGYKCFWVALSVRILGLDVGAGFYLQREPYEYTR